MNSSSSSTKSTKTERKKLTTVVSEQTVVHDGREASDQRSQLLQAQDSRPLSNGTSPAPPTVGGVSSPQKAAAYIANVGDNNASEASQGGGGNEGLVSHGSPIAGGPIMVTGESGSSGTNSSGAIVHMTVEDESFFARKQQKFPAVLFDKLELVVWDTLSQAHFNNFISSPMFKQYQHFLYLSKKAVTEDDFTLFRVLGRGGFGQVNGKRKLNVR